MNSCKVRLEQIADPANLREAFLRAARGKGGRADVRTFRENLDAELVGLRGEILRVGAGGVADWGQFTRFTIFEPKERVIHAPCFRERVLHHALVGPCEADMDHWLIADTYACRRGKGREAGLRRAEHHTRRHRWFLKLDVAKYFDSIPHERLLAEVARRWSDARVVALWRAIVTGYTKTPGCGLPIGALTSQHLANFYLAPLDRLAKETLRAPGYCRYMDDMVLWADDRALLQTARHRCEAALDELGLTLKPNWHLQRTAQGLSFLGYRVRPDGSTVSRASRRRFVRRWQGIERAREGGTIREELAQRRVLAMAAFMRVAQRDRTLELLFSGHGHRAPTASTAVAVGGTPPTTAAPPTATGTPRITATTTWASAPP